MFVGVGATIEASCPCHSIRQDLSCPIAWYDPLQEIIPSKVIRHHFLSKIAGLCALTLPSHPCLILSRTRGTRTCEA